jgi:FkbM family methyltransferase
MAGGAGAAQSSDADAAHVRAERIRAGLNRAVQAQHIQELLSSRDINVVLDVGGHEGGFGTFLRGVHYEGPIVSFEPVAGSVEALERIAAEHPPWIVHKLALGERDEEAAMTVFHQTVLNSLHRPSEYGLAEFPDSFQEDHEETVQVRRLDGFLREWDPPVEDPRMLLKIDVQGSEWEVLAGAEECLDDFTAVQVEAAVKPFYEGVRPWWDVVRLLGERGFAMSGVFPVTRDRLMRIIEVDCVFVRDGDDPGR